MRRKLMVLSVLLAVPVLAGLASTAVTVGAAVPGGQTWSTVR